MSEEIFKKDLDSQEPEKPKKKKRVLSQKQLDALAKGRERRKQKLLEKQNHGASKEMIKQDKDNRKKKKELQKEQKKVRITLDNVKLLNQEEERKNELDLFKNKFNKLKNDLLDKTEDPKFFKGLRTFFKKYNVNEFQSIEEVKEKIKKDMEEYNKN